MSAIPQKGDMAFSGPADVKHGMAFLKVIEFDRSYIEGFKAAADTLVQSILGPDAHRRYQMVIPVGYLYRHYLELQLKYRLFLGNESGIFTTTPKQRKGHFLTDLWERARILILKLYPNESRETLDAVEAIINEFHTIDETGEGFRYWMLNDNKTPSPEKLPVDFSLQNLSDQLAKMQNYLSTIAVKLEQECDGPG
ncbi:MAG TPA: hypothetical protein VHV55_20740 [Pirellulales bacterium]|jgi:hypothetical protein|nr:hypothetical protein [Pirellulales bacterium]